MSSALGMDRVLYRNENVKCCWISAIRHTWRDPENLCFLDKKWHYIGSCRSSKCKAFGTALPAELVDLVKKTNAGHE